MVDKKASKPEAVVKQAPIAVVKAEVVEAEDEYEYDEEYDQEE